jgi:hypothetical protein
MFSMVRPVRLPRWIVVVVVIVVAVTQLLNAIANLLGAA